MQKKLSPEFTPTSHQITLFVYIKCGTSETRRTQDIAFKSTPVSVSPCAKKPGAAHKTYELTLTVHGNQRTDVFRRTVPRRNQEVRV